MDPVRLKYCALRHSLSAVIEIGDSQWLLSINHCTENREEEIFLLGAHKSMDQRAKIVSLRLASFLADVELDVDGRKVEIRRTPDQGVFYRTDGDSDWIPATGMADSDHYKQCSKCGGIKPIHAFRETCWECESATVQNKARDCC